MKRLIVAIVVFLALLICANTVLIDGEKRTQQEQISLGQTQAEAIREQAIAIQALAEANAQAMTAQADALQAQSDLLRVMTFAIVAGLLIAGAIAFFKRTNKQVEGVES